MTVRRSPAGKVRRIATQFKTRSNMRFRKSAGRASEFTALDALTPASMRSRNVRMSIFRIGGFRSSVGQRRSIQHCHPPFVFLRCQFMPQNFHARFSATGKLYRYRIWAAPILPPLKFGRAWHISSPLDVDLLKTAGKKFVGTHDFAVFAANRGQKEQDTMRTIWSVQIRRSGPRIAIEIAGDGFLYKMVRLMVGAMTQVALNKMNVDEIVARLKSGHTDGSRFVAPAKGLYLVKIWY